MTVGELLKNLSVCCDNEIVLLDVDEEARGEQYNLNLKQRGWDYVPYGYSKYEDRYVWGIHLINKKMMISISRMVRK